MANVVPPLVFALLVMASVAFAGCVDDEAAPDAPVDDVADQAAAAEVTATTGAISGAVTSDLFEPLPAAVVTIVETGASTKVARNGEFVFNDVTPGRYQIHATRDGYLPGARTVEVRAGEIVEAMFQLRLEPSTAPWTEEIEQTGLLVLGYRYHVAPTGECQVVENEVYPVLTCDGRTLNGIGASVARNITDDTETQLWEVFWTSAGPIGQYFYIDLYCSEVETGPAGRITDEHPCYVAYPSQTSPLSVRMDKSHSVENDYEWTGIWNARVYSGAGLLGTYGLINTDVGLAYQQAFTFLITLFHGAEAPDGYSGIPDA